jgi:hypothetical protein
MVPEVRFVPCMFCCCSPLQGRMSPPAPSMSLYTPAPALFPIPALSCRSQGLARPHGSDSGASRLAARMMLFFRDSCPSLLNSVLRPRGPFSHAQGHRAYTSRGGCLLIAHTTCCFLPSFGEKWQARLDAAGRARGEGFLTWFLERLVWPAKTCRSSSKFPAQHPGRI